MEFFISSDESSPYTQTVTKNPRNRAKGVQATCHYDKAYQRSQVRSLKAAIQRDQIQNFLQARWPLELFSFYNGKGTDLQTMQNAPKYQKGRTSHLHLPPGPIRRVNVHRPRKSYNPIRTTFLHNPKLQPSLVCLSDFCTNNTPGSPSTLSITSQYLEIGRRR